ncbi:MotE family protein [Jeotgalibacillus sp. R-1-5s-1]|uniref:MotE family protein n=1 Tax=Jeotgalibacillus sp. R-1-5s-1 TaxID=2555897 RepID=UPI00106A7C5F|nr:MotE family protein [Jeotgalibacillus sp. R-1-5s-1]TFE03496.1 hypothetical protein E2491_01515 [Jeotgalibacillus sp. R-1-5s-1]
MNKQQSIKEEAEETRSPGKLQVFFLLIFVPILFLTFAALIVLTILDINVFEKIEEAGIDIPFTGESEDPAEITGPENQAQQIVSLEAQLEEKDVELARFEQEIISLEDENDLLIEEQERLLAEIESMESAGESARKEFSEVVAVYDEMDGKEAAPVIMNLNDENAIRILSGLSSEKLAEIFAEMPSEEAARYTELIANRTP